MTQSWVSPVLARWTQSGVKGALIRQHHARTQRVGALANAEDVLEPALLQGRDGCCRDHAAVGDDADPADAEAVAQAVDHRDQHAVTSAVLPGHISVQIGRPSASITTARIICIRSGRWSLE